MNPIVATPRSRCCCGRVTSSTSTAGPRCAVGRSSGNGLCRAAWTPGAPGELRDAYCVAVPAPSRRRARALEDYQGGVPRCARAAVTTRSSRRCNACAATRLVRPEKTVFVSGIGARAGCRTTCVRTASTVSMAAPADRRGHQAGGAPTCTCCEHRRRRLLQASAPRTGSTRSATT